ncbi:hypothetical protein ACFO4P_11065 [Epilithonimonas pallida]|uniref:Outer membrane protein beta-barrel domain-containing protein n=1 Tax=Epilithonimonas pallida TaxID=373671 RepID=A0ABY1R4Y5_9FLAO|nr:hypothetical protein [Epilithonimonas pallida]SMP92351.1 hypothetical protein SAMN05421679_10410 [Epilithonimonas pallida]
MISKILCFILMLFTISAASQSLITKSKKYPAFFVGYQFSPEARDNTETWESSKMHILEIAYGKVLDHGTRHGESAAWYTGTDLIFNYKESFLVAPKIGANTSGGALVLGGEIQFQTDFNKVVPRAMPYLGLGGLGRRLFIGYNFRLLKTEFFPVNTLNIGLTLPIRTKKG